MPKTADLSVKIGDHPNIVAALTAAANEVDTLRTILRAWSDRVVCEQCGFVFSQRACGPTHALIANAINRTDPPVPVRGEQ